MVPKLLLRRVLLVILLTEMNSSSAFPGGRSSLHPEPLQGERENQQQGYGYGNRRPLHYIRALRQANKTSKISDQIQGAPQNEPELSPLMVRSFAQTQNQPHLSHQTQNLYLPWSEAGTKKKMEMSPSLSALQKKHPLKVPYANFPFQNKEEDSSTKGLGLSSGVKDNQKLYRPTGLQIFTSSSGSDDSLETGSTQKTHVGKKQHEVIKPSFQLSLSVPFQSPKPSSDEVHHPGNPQAPGANGFFQDTDMEQNPQSNSVWGESEWVLINVADSVQQPAKHHETHTQPTDSKLVTFPPGPGSQLVFASEQTSQSTPPTLHYPLQPDNMYSGYYNPQRKPTGTDYGNRQIGQTSSPDATNVPGQVPSANNYAQPQTLQSVDPLLTFPSEQYNHGQFETSYGHGQNLEASSHPSLEYPEPPIVDQSHYNIPLSGYYDGDAAANNYYGKDNVEQMGQSDFSYQHSRDHIGHDVLPNHPTTFDPTSNYQSLSTGYQTQAELPDEYNGRQQLDGKPKYTKLLIHMDDVTDQDGGQYNNFEAQTTNYYSEETTAGTLLSNPTSYMPINSQASGMDSGVGQYAYHPTEQVETEQVQTSYPLPGHTNHAPTVGVNAGAVQTNFGQQEPSFHAGQDDHYSSHGQYATEPWQPQYTSKQGIDSSYPVSDEGIQQYSTYGLSHYSNPLPSDNPYQY
ncbi:uncharacterized protein LOC117814146 [Notolabrus celidotus]|uniref:uncharacterized protein LOC117814146 n=1 Tax=Notolabrus celidotus TaxID=1203425 RepID=UPI0014903000|nr:uncharacterized protein LOC117814146 [Notolabrus celidotus]